MRDQPPTLCGSTGWAAIPGRDQARLAHDIFDVLVEECGAVLEMRAAFVYGWSRMTEPMDRSWEIAGRHGSTVHLRALESGRLVVGFTGPGLVNDQAMERAANARLATMRAGRQQEQPHG